MSATPGPEGDLNSVIANAVNARVEAQVLAALSGDEVLGRYVMAALNQPVQLPKPGSSYDKITVTFLNATLQKAVQAAVEQAVRAVVSDEVTAIEDAVRKELRRKIATVAEQLVGSLSKAAESPYGIKVDLNWPSR